MLNMLHFLLSMLRPTTAYTYVSVIGLCCLRIARTRLQDGFHELFPKICVHPQLRRAHDKLHKLLAAQAAHRQRLIMLIT